MKGKGQWLCSPSQIYRYSQSNFSYALGKNFDLLFHGTHRIIVVCRGEQGELKQTKLLDCSEKGENMKSFIGQQKLSTVYDIAQGLVQYLLDGYGNPCIHYLCIQGTPKTQGIGYEKLAVPGSSGWAEEGRKMGGTIFLLWTPCPLMSV